MPIFSKTLLASAVASMCLSAAVANPVGFCTGKSMGIYSDPSAPLCTTSYYQCVHGADAVVGSCGSSTRFWLRGGEGSWYYLCDHPDRVPACQVPLIETFCHNKAAGSYARGEGDNTCTDKYWECDGSSTVATEMTCAADQVFDGTSCVGIQTVLACPAITRACDGQPAGNIVDPNADACTTSYYTCDGTSPQATEASCPAGTHFDSASGVCGPSSLVTACTDVTGFCSANTGEFFPAYTLTIPGSTDCSTDYLQCTTGATDAVVQSCAAGEVPDFSNGFACVSAPAECAVCSLPLGSFVADPSDCTNSFVCVSGSALSVACGVDQAFDGTSCVAIETVLTCPAITRACAGQPAGNIVDPNADACTTSYYTCDGTSPQATEASCAAGEAFDSVSGTCVAEASVAACAVVEAAGYCTGKGMAGVFPNPNEESDLCSSSFWVCNWTGATNAIERSCPPGTVVHYNAPAPTWNYWCAPAPAGC